MKRIALITPLYGRETTGSVATYARMIAEHLVTRAGVDVLTTRARSRETWRDWYARDDEKINGVNVHRFKVSRERDRTIDDFIAAYASEMSQGMVSRQTEESLYESMGPMSPDLIRYLRINREAYDVFVFLCYDNYLTVCGLPEVARRAVLIPFAHEGDHFHYALTGEIFSLPRAFVFLSEEERLLVRGAYPKTEPIPCAVVGAGVIVPEKIENNSLQQQWHLNSPYLCYVGTVSAEKGCDRLVQYFCEYKARSGETLSLLLLGQCDMTLPERADIMAMGYVTDDEKYAGMLGALATVCPANQEVMALTMSESLALGVPCIVNGGNSFLKNRCEKSNASLYYRDYFEFEGCVNYFLHHAAARDVMAQNARAYVQKELDWDTIIERFSAILFS